MALVEIPTRHDIFNYEFYISLDNNIFFFEFKYNKRKERWSVNIYDSDKNELLNGIPALTEVDLMSQYVSKSLPAGNFMFMDKEGDQKNAEEDDLGDRVLMIYSDDEEEE